MKSITFTLFVSALLVFPSLLSAQQTQTLFHGNVSHGGFGGPVLKFGEVNGSPGLWVGGRGGWIINFENMHSISIGGGGYGLVTNHKTPEPVGGLTEQYATIGYGGFIFEYTNRTYQLAHFTGNFLVGAGGLGLRDKNFSNFSDDTNSFFVVEPSLELELNVTTFFRITAGMGYRFTSGIGHAGFTDSDFSGINGTLTFKFGSF